jgi:hypothetical protein
VSTTRYAIARITVRLKPDTTGDHRRLAEAFALPLTLTMTLRRARGFVLRLVRRRALALIVGLVLIVPSAWVEFSGRYGAWWQDGLALVVSATGIAIFWTGVTGIAPDWVDEE